MVKKNKLKLLSAGVVTALMLSGAALAKTPNAVHCDRVFFDGDIFSNLLTIVLNDDDTFTFQIQSFGELGSDILKPTKNSHTYETKEFINNNHKVVKIKAHFMDNGIKISVYDVKKDNTDISLYFLNCKSFVYK